jgi:EAL domain-containing protein (putative c-di-GMP-specific phosphodiesterase class I)/CheY-like chemotaxis protein
VTTEGSDAIVVVDDDAVSREILALMLRAAGATRIISVATGHEALAHLVGLPRALVMCDVSMPQMDGVEFARRLVEVAPHAALFLVSGIEPKLLATVQTFAAKTGLRVVGSSAKPVTQERVRQALFSARVPLAPSPDAPRKPTAAELSAGLAADELELHYLPKVRISDGTILGVEALSRWRHPELGLLAPQFFIPLAEQSDLIWDLTMHVAQRAVAQTAAWRAAGLPLQLSFNISAGGSVRLRFPDELTAIARRHHLDPADITVELTETQLADSRDIYDVIARLRLKGFHLAIDDYGISNSGLEQLRRLPFSEFKVDRSLVHGAARHIEQRAILELSVQLGRRLDLAIVAEGVEHRPDWRELARLECDAAQGYLVSPPLPPARIVPWAQHWREQAPAWILRNSPAAGPGAEHRL